MNNTIEPIVVLSPSARQIDDSTRLLMAANAEIESLRVVNTATMTVCKELDAFQRMYETNTQQPGYMPGNDLYGGILMDIVRMARAALAKADHAVHCPQCGADLGDDGPDCNRCQLSLPDDFAAAEYVPEVGR